MPWWEQKKVPVVCAIFCVEMHLSCASHPQLTMRNLGRNAWAAKTTTIDLLSLWNYSNSAGFAAIIGVMKFVHKLGAKFMILGQVMPKSGLNGASFPVLCCASTKNRQPSPFGCVCVCLHLGTLGFVCSSIFPQCLGKRPSTPEPALLFSNLLALNIALCFIPSQLHLT